MILSEVRTEKEFLAILKRYARRYYKKYGTINFLGLVENQWSLGTETYWNEYFSNGFGMYDYVNGNEKLIELADSWVKS